MSKAGSLILFVARHSAWLNRVLSHALPTAEFSSYDRGRWEREYQEGGWDWLRNAREAVHQHIVACHCRHVRPNPAILDVGCGEGVLNELLRQGGYLSYTGIDISQAAVGSANARLADERTRFIAVDANVFESNERFDIVVFNETLYYFADPGATLRHFGRMLNADGVFVVSMALGSGLRDQMLKLRIWWDVASTHEVLDELTLYGAKRPMRIIKVLRPLRATGTGESD